jgi:hypothetical protein
MLLAGAASCLAPPAAVLAQTSQAPGRQVAPGLSARMAAFLHAISDEQPERIPGFFPSTGSFTHALTVHGESGDSSSVRRFAPAQKARAFRYGGPLWASVNLQFESQPVGLLVHQVLCRGMAWRPVSPTRFVPPGAGASSPTFVEWRAKVAGG